MDWAASCEIQEGTICYCASSVLKNGRISVRENGVYLDDELACNYRQHVVPSFYTGASSSATDRINK